MSGARVPMEQSGTFDKWSLSLSNVLSDHVGDTSTKVQQPTREPHAPNGVTEHCSAANLVDSPAAALIIMLKKDDRIVSELLMCVNQLIKLP